MKISTAQVKSLMDSNAQEVEAALVKQATVLQVRPGGDRINIDSGRPSVFLNHARIDQWHREATIWLE